MYPFCFWWTILKSCAWRKAYEKLREQQVIHRCQTAAFVRHFLFKIFFEVEFESFRLFQFITCLMKLRCPIELKVWKNSIKISWNSMSAKIPMRIQKVLSVLCKACASKVFFYGLGKFFFFCPEAADIFNGSLMSQRAKKSPSIFFKKKNRQVLKTCQSQFQNSLNSEWDLKKEKIFLKIRRKRVKKFRE